MCGIIVKHQITSMIHSSTQHTYIQQVLTHTSYSTQMHTLSTHTHTHTKHNRYSEQTVHKCTHLAHTHTHTPYSTQMHTLSIHTLAHNIIGTQSSSSPHTPCFHWSPPLHVGTVHIQCLPAYILLLLSGHTALVVSSLPLTIASPLGYIVQV